MAAQLGVTRLDAVAEFAVTAGLGAACYTLPDIVTGIIHRADVVIRITARASRQGGDNTEPVKRITTVSSARLPVITDLRRPCVTATYGAGVANGAGPAVFTGGVIM